MDYNYVGKILDGRYEIQEMLGVGGMAIVYRAYDNIDDRSVAVKILKEEFLANEEFRRRFKNESKAIAMLSHPNIVKVYDVSYGERLQYIVMEYVEGITLKEYIEQRRVIPWKEAVHFLTQILRALQHAHDRGVVHRDIKPQNIMLLHSGNIKVTDFGIARFSRSETRTMTENAIGSVHYISPEQARGDFTDGKTDIYSLGVVLYEMLTGELPFQSDSTVSVAIMQLQSEPRRPREINDQIPLGLEQITIRAMQKAPAERYQSAAEMLLDLEEFKRNPLIRFEYSYYVDKEPTKYVSPAERARPVRVATAPLPPVIIEEEEGVGRSRSLGLMIGIVAGIVGLLLLIGGAIWFFTNDPNVTVDRFIGRSLVEIQNDMDYWSRTYRINIESGSSNEFAPGQVFHQNPLPGHRVARADDGLVHITLYVVEDETRRVPDVRNTPLAEAEARLRELGLTPRPIQQFNRDVDEGNVISSDPVQGTAVTMGQMVILYVATRQRPDGDRVPVPDLITWDVDTARTMLEQVDLRMGNVEEVDHNAPRGEIVWQSTDPGEEVESGSRIDVRTSSGAMPERNLNVNVPLPTRLGTARLTVYLDGVRVFNSVVLLAGSRTVPVTGSGSDVALQANLDDERIFTATIDFSADPPVISNAQSHLPEEDLRPTVPNVVGQSLAQAIETLEGAGFTVGGLYYVEAGFFEGILGATSGHVARQTPSGGTQADEGAAIRLYIYE